MESELATYDWDLMQEEKLQVEILATNSRRDKLENRLKIVITNEDYVSKRLEMHETFKEYYAECRYEVLISHKPIHNVNAEAGHFFVLFDRHRCLDSEGKFLRVKVTKVLHRNKKNPLLDKFEGILIDLDETVVFCRYELYNLDADHRILPPQVFRARLKSLKAFEGSTRLARAMDIALFHHGYAFQMKITSVPKPGVDFIEVDFIMEGIGMTLSEYVGLMYIELSKTEISMLLKPIRGTVFEEVYVTNISSDGKIAVRVGSRILQAVKYCLEEAEDIFDVCQLVHVNETKNLTTGDVYLAQCPHTSRLERCQMQSILQATTSGDAKCAVFWMDIGEVSEIALEDLVNAEFFSPILKHAPPQGFKFQLYNIKAVTASPQDVFNAVPREMPVTMGINSVTRKRKVRQLPLVLVYIDDQNGRIIINERLVNTKLAIPLDPAASYPIPSMFKMKPQPFWEVPYPCIASEWLHPGCLYSLKHPALAVGQRIVVKAPLYYYRDPLKFVVQPVGSADHYTALRKKMKEYFTDNDWVIKETLLYEIPQTRDQHVYLYEWKGVYYRVKIVNFLDLPVTNADSPISRAELFLIDAAMVIISDKPSIYRVVNPWRLLTDLGPQGALTVWKRAKDIITKDGKDKYTARAKELNRSLHEIIGVENEVTAIICEIFYDHYGRANLVVDFDV